VEGARGIEDEAGIEALYEGLSPEKQALLAMALARRGRAGNIPVAPRDGAPVPASFAQERLWFVDQLEPGSAAYVMPVAVRLRGSLDVAALRRCLTEIVRRHEVLRTNLVPEDGRPYQVVRAPAPVDLPVVDAVDGDTARLLDAYWRAEAGRPFDLRRDLNLRASLVRTGPDEHVLFLAMHHVACDGWSMGIFVRELSDLYAAYTTGRPPAVPELPIQYADYAVWQREQLPAVIDAHLEHWRDRLAGAPVLELLTDRPRPANRSSAGGSVPLRLDRRTVERVDAFAALANATQFMVLQAVLAVLLWRWSGQDDVVIGFPVANRDRAEIEPLIGFFVNTLPLRVDLSEDPSFRDLLAQVRGECVRAYEHQSVPFERLVQELNADRSAGPVPLIQVMLALRNVPMPQVRLPGLALEPLPLESVSTKFDLCLDLVPDGAGGIDGRAEYSTDLFDADTIRRMVEAYHLLLADLLAEPDAPVSRARMVTADDAAAIVERFSGGGRPSAAATAGTLHGLFERQADRSPDAVAVACGDRRLTFRELDRRANRLAWHLRALGLAPEQLVGVCLPRSEDLVVALLALLKAGGAYVPLDPMYPQRRVRFMAEDAQVRLILSTSEVVASGVLEPADGAGDAPAPRVVRLDAERDLIAAQADTRPPPVAAEPNLAYVIYTSGSTGRPKGSVNEHGGVANSITGMNQVYRLTPADRMLAISSVNYDMSVYEIFGALAAGARVVVPSDIETTDPIQLRELLRRQGVTAWSSAPALLDMLVNYACEHDGLDGVALRVVGVGGDRMPPALPARLRRLLPQVRLHNLAGMTEVSYCSTYHLVTADETRGGIPWGRPLPHHRVYVLDRHGRPVPVGAPGELFIGGAGPGRGYWRRPALTATRFVPDPHSPEPGGRMYATGDFARFLPNGDLEFLGRLDKQLKIRGFRIEPGEVEGALVRHPAVVEPVVSTWEEPSGQRRLVAYLTVRGESPSTTELRAFLGERLPDHMVPSIFVILDELPKLPSGKLNRAALPPPSGHRPALESAYEAPDGPLETVLADLLADVLDLERVGAADDFFELGGHSLLATQAVSRIRELFEVDLPIPAFLGAATVRDIAGRLRRTGAESGVDVDEVAALVLDLSRLSADEVAQRLGE